MSSKVVSRVRDGLVILSALLMIVMVIFQWLEIQKFELQDVIGTRLSALFASSDGEPAVPAASEPAAPVSGKFAPKAPGM